MKKSYLVASALGLAITGWMVAGYFTAGSRSEAAVNRPSARGGAERMTVAVRTQRARTVAQYIVAQGQVEPNRAVTVRAEIAGRIAEVVAEEGRPVRANDVLARVEINDRRARLKKAEALLRERRQAHDAARRLGAKGHQTQRRIDETFSALQTAQAELEQIQLEITKTTIRAPFDGILESRRVEVGDYAAVNGEVATIVDNDPLVAIVQIAQQAIGRIAPGAVANISFATGHRGEGVVRFIAPRAEEATRTFRVEIEVPNPDSRIPSGTSAEARIPTGVVSAHFVSPALLTLNDTGQVGLKAVNDAGIVVFHPIDVVLAEANGMWVSGLPNETRIIAVGQGFVRDGETVRAVPAQHERGASLSSRRSIEGP